MFPFRMYWWNREANFFYVGNSSPQFFFWSRKQMRNRINEREERVCEPLKAWIIYEHEHRFSSLTLFINAVKLFRGVKYPLKWITYQFQHGNVSNTRSSLKNVVTRIYYWSLTLNEINKNVKKKNIHLIPLKV